MSTNPHVDPVCGMAVEESAAAIQTQHDGQVYWFCCPECLAKFRRNPALFTPRPTPAAPGFWSKLYQSLFGGCCSCHTPAPPPAEDTHPQPNQRRPQ